MARNTFTVRLHSGRRVDRVAEETVARHFDADHSGDARARVEPDADPQRHVRPVRNAKVPHAVYEIQRHRGDLAGVF